MRSFTRRALCASALALVATAGSSTAEAQDPKGTLVFAVESLAAQTLDPILEQRPGNAVYQAVMYDSLVGFDIEKGGLGPGVAESWSLSDDGLTWTFKIRAGQRWHNGDPLTAHDVKFSLERHMNHPGSIAAAAASMRRSIKAIEVADDATVRVTTNSPQLGLPANLSRAVAPEGTVMPKKYIEAVGDEEFRRKPIGSGPWKFVKNVAGDRIEFEAVDWPHWRGRPSFKSLVILQIPEEATRVAMTRTGEAAIASIGPETMQGAERAGLAVVAVPGTMQAVFQFWGTWRPAARDNPVAKVRVRQALSLAIDRKQVIEHVMAGRAEIPRPYSTYAFTESVSTERWKKWADENFRYDPVLARKILAEEGYPNGFELKFANTALPGTQFMVDVGTAIVDMWTKIGVKVTVKHYEWGGFPALTRANQEHLTGWASMYRTVGRPDSPWRYNAAFSSDGLERLFGDKDNCDAACKRFDQLYNAVINERDAKKRTEINDQLVEHVAASWLSIPIIEGMGYYAVNKTKAGRFSPIPGRHELGDVFERVPRPDQAAWGK